MKKMLILCILVMSLTVLGCSAACADEEENGFSYIVLNDDTVCITACTETGDITIPSVLGGRQVTNLNIQLFYGKSGITSVYIPAGVVYFGEDKSGDYQWQYVFSYCEDLKEIRVDSGNPAFCSVDGVLYSKNKETLINYPCAKEDSVYHVPAETTMLLSTAFASCRNLRQLYLDGKDTTWCTYTFFDTGNLTVYYLPGGITQATVEAAESLGQVHAQDSYRNSFQLIITEKPAIVTQPSSAAAAEGRMASFKVEASGAAAYQWYSRSDASAEWQPDVGATANTYMFPAEKRYNGYQYRCEVSNENGSVFTEPVTLTVKTVPAITTQPADLTVTEGDAVSFQAAAKDAAGYQWYSRSDANAEWQPETDAAEAVYSFTAEARHNGYQYRCEVSNDNGSVFTNAVTLTVKTVPIIITQPADLTVTEGDTAAFQVEANGAESYRWYFRSDANAEWETVTGAFSAVCSFTAEARHNGYQYQCKLKNDNGTVFTDTVTLTVEALPVIITQPANLTVTEGNTAAFQVEASDAASYQWYSRPDAKAEWQPEAGAVEAAYSFTAEARHSGYQYRCEVKNKNGTVFTDAAKLTVKTLPVITAQPADLTVDDGKKAAFRVEANDATGYQWYSRDDDSAEWQPETGATAETISFIARARYRGKQYQCEVKNRNGSVFTEPVTLTVKTVPIITVQPADLMVTEGEKVTFRVEATDAEEYQWYSRKDADAEWQPETDAVEAAYSFIAEVQHDGSQYQCEVRNNLGTALTDAATLTVDEISRTGFADAEPRSEYYKAVCFVLEKGLMTPVSEDAFGTDEPATAGDFYIGMYMLLGGKPIEANKAIAYFSDNGCVPWVITADAQLTAKDCAALFDWISIGLGAPLATVHEGTPGEPVTRGQMAQMFKDYYGKLI